MTSYETYAIAVEVLVAFAQLTFTVVTIYVISRAPTWAVNVGDQLGTRREDTERKTEVFRKLMQTRIKPNSASHIGAVNQVCIEFYNSNDILDALEDYITKLKSRPPLNKNEGENTVLNENEKESFVVLVQKISRSLGFEFEQFDLKSKYFIDKEIN